MPPLPSTTAKRPSRSHDAEPVVYPEVEAKLYKRGSPLGAMSFALAKNALGWEDEDSYKARVKREASDVVAGSKSVHGYGDDFLLKDPAGRKIRCWHNTKNRPFGEPWAKALAQEILFSGPGLPKEKRRWQFNGESIIIGRHGQVLSGQHRLIALILAVLEWRKDPDRYVKELGKTLRQIWPEEPYLECVVVTGVDEGQQTTRTMDNVKPRSLGDVFYTSDVLRKYKGPERAEATRMLAVAVDLCWKRTGVDIKYQTHAESSDWLDRHKKLLNCVDHIFRENEERAITKRNLQPGQMAALMYLMAVSATTPEDYWALRSEKALNFSLMDNAQDFFQLMSAAPDNPRAKVLDPLYAAIGGILDDEEESAGGHHVQKRAIVAKAWNAFLEKGEIAEEDLELEYVEDDSKLKLAEYPTVGGVDLGDGPKKDRSQKPGETDPTPEELAAQREAEKKAKLSEMEKKLEEAKKAKAQAKITAMKRGK